MYAIRSYYGVYISEDRGATWSKNNRMIGENGDITDVQFDIFDASLIHLTQRGSGFYKGRNNFV